MVDVLRGFALLGLIVVNAEFIFQDLAVGFDEFTGTADTAARWVSAAFFQQKFYLLFSLMFGYGLSLQLSRVGAGADLRPRYRRRMIGLLILGVGHAVFFFVGDILVLYALIGALAYLFRNAPTRNLLVAAVAVYGVVALLLLLGSGLALLADGSPATIDADAARVYSEGGFFDVVVQHFWDWLYLAPLIGLTQGPPVFALFLVGIALGRSDLLSNFEKYRGVAWRVVLVAGGIGAAGSMVAATLLVDSEGAGSAEILGFALQFIFAPLLTAAYASALGLLVGSRPSRVVTPLEAAGRMSLTVYLLESVIASTLAYSYGFGLFGEVGPAENFAIAFAIWAGLCLFSLLWLKWARFGPFEWLLRSWTYRRFMRLRERPPREAT